MYNQRRKPPCLDFVFLHFSIGLPVWPWLFHRTSFPLLPCACWAGSARNRSQTTAVGEPVLQICLQAKLPASALVFAPISMPGTCKKLQGVGFLVVAGDHPSRGLCGGCSSEVQKCQGKTSQAEEKLLVWCPWFPGTIFLSPSLQKSFQQKSEDAKGCWKKLFWEW